MFCGSRNYNNSTILSHPPRWPQPSQPTFFILIESLRLILYYTYWQIINKSIRQETIHKYTFHSFVHLLFSSYYDAIGEECREVSLKLDMCWQNASLLKKSNFRNTFLCLNRSLCVFTVFLSSCVQNNAKNRFF